MESFFKEFIAFVWPGGVLALVVGFAITDFAGQMFHRFVFHGIPITWNGKPYHLVPWKASFEKHMWHHHVVYSNPGAPGQDLKPFRQRHFYYKAAEKSDHKFGREPSENVAFDYAEWLMSRLGVPFGLDWMIGTLMYTALIWFIIGDPVVFAWFFIGGFSAGCLSHFMHDSFHIIPYDRLRDMPARAWLNPDIVIANVMAHAPGLRRYYAYLLRVHVAHHYDVRKVERSNVRYKGVFPDRTPYNFSIYVPLVDLLLMTFSGKVFERPLAPGERSDL